MKDKAKGYLHGFSKQEQERLYHQSRFLEEKVYEKINLADTQHLLEVGCGVGAQTAILLERFPHLKITSVDASDKQLARAKEYLAKPIKEKQVTLVQSFAEKLPFEDNSHDSAFLCWFLEHVANPVDVLREVKRVLKPGGKIYCNEVLNAAFFLNPYSHSTLKYWLEFNDHQWNLRGDPFVGAKLGNYLLAAGFQNIDTDVTYYHFDNRSPKLRSQFIDEWASHLLSGADALIKVGKATPELVKEMKEELARVKESPDAVFFYGWVRAQAQIF
jgi:ubiquinone/menaquinone biosynthesis C-methylase UbiE